MPYNDYICGRSGKHFRDIDDWRNCGHSNNCTKCPFAIGESSTDNIKCSLGDHTFLNVDEWKNCQKSNNCPLLCPYLPPLKPLKWDAISLIIVSLLGLIIIGAVWGVVALIRYLIS